MIYRLRPNFLLPVSAAALALLAGSCRDLDDNPASAEAQVTNLVTYTGMKGGAACFQYDPAGGASAVRLLSPGAREYPEGQRLLLTYYPCGGDENASGPVEVVREATISAWDIETGDIADFPDWQRTPVYVSSIWRGGKWLNMQVGLPAYPQFRVFKLLADNATIDDSTPVLYLVNQSPGDNTFERSYYVSFYLGDFMASHPEATAVEVRVSNSNLSTDSFTIQL